jgi:hypothetical protein
MVKNKLPPIEWAYKNIPPEIFVEKLIEPAPG